MQVSYHFGKLLTCTFRKSNGGRPQRSIEAAFSKNIFFSIFLVSFGSFKTCFTLRIFLIRHSVKKFFFKNSFLGLIQLIFFHGSPTYCPGGLSLRFGVCQMSSKKVMRIIFFIFSSLWWPLMTSEVDLHLIF